MTPDTSRAAVPAQCAIPLTATSDMTVSDIGGRVEVHATKTIVADDPYIQGHFPDFPIYPGIFVFETLRQAVTAIAGEGRWAEMRHIRSARFLLPLFPGDRLTAVFQVTLPVLESSLEVEAACTRQDGKLAARLKIQFELLGATHA
jgi:3-hydroxyacyl-[acyl-carrier-protein] dehydratase